MMLIARIRTHRRILLVPLAGLLVAFGCQTPRRFSKPLSEPSERPSDQPSALLAAVEVHSPILDLTASPDVFPNPQGEVTFRFRSNSKGRARLCLVDGLARTRWTSEPMPLQPGTDVMIRWNGSTDDGRPLEPGALQPMFLIETATGSQIWRSVESSGGEPIVVDTAEVDLLAGRVVYTLPTACRLRVRVGSRFGYLYATLADWELRSAGQTIERWSGLDPTGRVTVGGLPELQFAISGYRMPAGSVIVEQPRDREPGETTDQPFGDLGARRSAPVAPKWGRPLRSLRSPRIRLESQLGDGPVRVRAGEWLPLAIAAASPSETVSFGGAFEINLIVDGQLLREEPRGILPWTGRLPTTGLSPGLHVLTANVGGFSGQYATASLEFEILSPVSGS